MSNFYLNVPHARNIHEDQRKEENNNKQIKNAKQQTGTTLFLYDDMGISFEYFVAIYSRKKRAQTGTCKINNGAVKQGGCLSI